MEMVNELGLIEVKLASPDDFLKVKETLTRIGISDQSGKTLSQTCHIFHKRNRYFIVHFLQMFMLDGKRDKTWFSDEDRARVNYVVNLLEKWNLVTPIGDVPVIEAGMIPRLNLKIIPHRNKSEWTLVQKYTIGS